MQIFYFEKASYFKFLFLRTWMYDTVYYLYNLFYNVTPTSDPLYVLILLTINKLINTLITVLYLI